MKLIGEAILRVRRPDRSLKAELRIRNLTTIQGYTYLLGGGFLGGAQLTTWTLGLIASGAILSENDTLASHPGWNEITDYTGGRPNWNPADESHPPDSQNVIGNYSGPATVTMTAAGSAAGITLISGSVLFSEAIGPPSEDVGYSNGDVMEILYHMLGISQY